MNLDVLLKYLVWMAFFVIALLGVYTMLKKLGVL